MSESIPMTRWVTIGIVVAIAVLVVLTVTQRGREGLSCNDPTCGGEMQDKGLLGEAPAAGDETKPAKKKGG